MRFGALLLKQQVPEWKDAYINYKNLKKLLKPYTLVIKKYQNTIAAGGDISESTHTASKKKEEKGRRKKDPILYLFLLPTDEELKKLKYFEEAFEEYIQSEFEKINNFFEFKLFESFKLWRLTKLNIQILKEKQREWDERAPEYRFQIKRVCLEFFRELQLLVNFINLNHEGYRKIFKKHKKITQGLEVCVARYFKVSQLFKDSYIQKNSFLLLKIKQDLENLYLDTFYGTGRGGRKRTTGHQELQNVAEGRLVTFWESYLYGFFSGFSCILLLAIFILSEERNIDLDSDAIFVEHFPLFRGAALAILYMWLLACNVYIWTKSNINYRLIFKFNYHYSTFSEIMTRMMCFSAIFLLMFTWYIILRDEKGLISRQISILPKQFTPLIVWISILGYIFFPSRKMFNWTGRLYFFDLMKRIILFHAYPVDFVIAWTTDQMVSFVAVFKDFEYSLCYYFSILFGLNEKSCMSQYRFTNAFLVAVLPLLFRMFQCMKVMHQNKIIFGKDLLNLIKYTFAASVAYSSYLAGIHDRNPSYVEVWIILAGISSAYSYFWDLKMDWGFLEPNSKHRFLRKTLAYSTPNLYYFAISANFFLRLSWTLSISPAIIKKVIRPELFFLLVGFLEQLRRALWNLFRVEKEHIHNVGELKAVGEMKLPFTIPNSPNLQRIEEEAFLEYRRGLKRDSFSAINIGDNQQFLEMNQPLIEKEESSNLYQKHFPMTNLHHSPSMHNPLKASPSDSGLNKSPNIPTMKRHYSTQTTKDMIRQKKEQFNCEKYRKEIKEFEENIQLTMNEIHLTYRDDIPDLATTLYRRKGSFENIGLAAYMAEIEASRLSSDPTTKLLKLKGEQSMNVERMPHVEKVQIQEMARQELAKTENVSKRKITAEFTDEESLRD